MVSRTFEDHLQKPEILKKMDKFRAGKPDL